LGEHASSPKALASFEYEFTDLLESKGAEEALAYARAVAEGYRSSGLSSELPALWATVARALRERGYAYLAVEVLKEALEEAEEDAWLLQQELAASLAQAGEEEEAVDYYAMAVSQRGRLVGLPPEDYSRIGAALESAGMLDEALREYKRSLAEGFYTLSEEELACRYMDIARVLVSMGEDEEALWNLEEALGALLKGGVYDRAAEVSLQMATILHRIGLLEDAERFYKSTIRLSPGSQASSRAYLGLARVLAELGRAGELRSLLEEALSAELDEDDRRELEAMWRRYVGV